MIKFQQKKLLRTKTLGERLRKIREESELSIEEVAQQTQIQKKYLEALERGSYASLPGPVYVESFLKKYSAYLGVSTEFVLSLYHQQEKKTLKKEYTSKFTPTPKEIDKALITPVLIRRILIGIVVVALMTYVGFEVSKIFSPPELIISNPQDYITVNDNYIEITGSTEQSATLSINGQEIFINDDGSFSKTITLKEGINNISISATKEKSKDTIIVRRVLYENIN
ncbi:MAG: helix-turn-helix domain-containing protein [bacterium]|nr:helix-turn-helix domain-containing protein [bacterium]